MSEQLLVSISFEATIIEWRGPAPFLFLVVPDEHVGELRYAAQLASYGWGVIPVRGRIGATEFATSLFPRQSTYYVPVKKAVQRAEAITLGDTVHVSLQIFDR